MFSVLLESAVNKWKTLPETVTSLRGRTVIITGSNVGLGLEAAKRFYEMNPTRLILAVRDISKGQEARSILLGAGEKHAAFGSVEGQTNVEVWELDLTSFESVKRFAKKCQTELERLDILLENAALRCTQWSVTKDGWETELQVNVLSTFLLAALLAPLLAKTAKLPPLPGSPLKPHLVVVTSDTHYFAPLHAHKQSNILAAMNDKTQYVQSERHADTKALGIFLTQELAKNPSLKDVVICSVNPGFCRSGLLMELPQVFRAILYGLLARTTVEGSKTFTWASLNNDIPVGAYTSSCQVTPTGGVVTSGRDADKIQEQLWEEMTIVLGKEAPQTASIWTFYDSHGIFASI